MLVTGSCEMQSELSDVVGTSCDPKMSDGWVRGLWSKPLVFSACFLMAHQSRSVARSFDRIFKANRWEGFESFELRLKKIHWKFISFWKILQLLENIAHIGVACTNYAYTTLSPRSMSSICTIQFVQLWTKQTKVFTEGYNSFYS